MKKCIYILCIIFSISIAPVNGQELFSKWHSSYFDKEFDVKISNEIKNGVFDIYVHAIDENMDSSICLNFNSDTIADFILFLENVKSKYIEWKNIAIANNVSDMTKEMDYITPRCDVCWLYGGEWFFSFGQKLKPTFMILDDGRMVVIIYKEFTSSSNRYITDTIYMAWGCEQDIDSLIKALNVDEMRNKINSKINTQQLFN